jgi:WD40 repeat protein
MKPMPDSPPTLPTIPDYRLLRAVGRGAYGEVWLARSVTGIYRAVKIVHRANFNDDYPFEREFAGIKRFEPVSLGQDSQVSILHVGRNNDAGFYYYVMEIADDIETGEEIFPDRYVPKTLKELRARRQRLPASEAVDISLALTRALAHLHVNDLVHRDIKPSNVIFVHGIPKLADIGLVSATDTSQSYVGTEGFVPPEGPGRATADIFSLGKVIYEISTGQDRKDFPRLPDDLNTFTDKRALLELNEVVIKACEADVQRRYATAEAMREDLLLLQAGRSVRRLHVMERQFALVAKYGVAATIVTALAIGGFLWAAFQTRRAERAEADALARLNESNLNWVRANRLTGRPGQRFASLAELGRAAALTNRFDLRNEAIACFAIPDVRPLKRWPRTPAWNSFHFSPSFHQYGTNDEHGRQTVRDTITDQLQYELPGQDARTASVKASPDERFLATIDEAGHAQFWDLPTQSRRSIDLPPGGRVLTFTPDSRALVVRHKDGSLHFLSSTNGREFRSIPGPADTRWIRFDPAGEKFLTVVNGQAFIHQTADGRLVRVIDAPPGSPVGIRHAAWHPDGRRVALAWMYSLGLWDVGTGLQLSTFEGHEGTIVDLAFTDTGEWLASTCWDGTTRLWHTDTHREALCLPESGNSLSLSTSHGRIAFHSWEGQWAYLYELAIPSAVQWFTLPARVREVFTAQAAFSPGGELVAAVNKEAVYVFQPPNSAPLARLPMEGTYSVKFQPDGRGLLTCGREGVRRWPMAWSADHAELRLGPPVVLAPSRGQPVEMFYLSRGGEWMLADTGKRVLSFDPGQSAEAIHVPTEIRSGRLLNLSSDGRLALSLGYHDSRVQIWNPRAGVLITNLPCRNGRDAAFSPDGRWLACATDDATTFWRTDDWSPRHVISHQPEGQGRTHLAFSPDGRVAVVSVSESAIRLLVVETGEMLATLPTGRLLTFLAFSPGSDRLAAVFEPGYFQLWNLRRLREGLAAMNLDWPGNPFPPEPGDPGQPPITVVMASSNPVQ